jgi:hypothetical protein
VLVYGDHCETAAPRERLESLSKELAAVAAMAPGIARHAKLTGVLIEAGQLLQGVADADFAVAGMDCRAAATDHLAAFLVGLSRAFVRSSDSSFCETGELPQVPELADLPREVELRTPEGFAFYAVYPEDYAAAARKLRLTAPPRVIGIRSIGTTLAAVVAAALDAPPPLMLRPFGDPFARQVAIAPALASELLGGAYHYVIVDEGPGQSGSSFGAVADWLEARGVPLERIAFLPSHSGELGARASDEHRRRWRKAQRVAATFDQSWLRDMFGPLEQFATGSPWERLKFIARAGAGRMLLKFAGLGAIGECKFAMAMALHDARLTSEPLALVHGFLVERWLEDARPLSEDDRPVEEIGRYIGARARKFPAPGDSGASLAELLQMACRNASLVLGNSAAEAIRRASGPIEAMAPRVARVRTDNKLARHEWLRTADGPLIKTDALDHHRGHDLIGCQDVAWDVAGAIVEFALNAGETERLIGAVQCRVDPELLAFYRIAYLAFRVGQETLAGQLSGDAAGGYRSADRYATQLHNLLHQHDCLGTRQESLVG